MNQPTDPDVVAALDRWIDEVEAVGYAGPVNVLVAQARRARHEIVALRSEVHGMKGVARLIRAAALDEAAMTIASYKEYDGSLEIAAAVSALKDRIQ